jgi:tyrosine-protein kinase Etk/Wzc
MPIDVSHPEVREHADPAAVRPAAGRNLIAGDEISLLDILIILAERKRTVLTVTSIFAIVAIIISFVLPERFTASVTLLPPQQNSSMSAALASQFGNLSGAAALVGGSLGLKNPNDTFVAMLKSRTVEDAMVQRFGLMQEYHERYLSEPRKAFEKRATVDGSGKDGLIHVSVEDRDANRAAELANGYVDQFRTLSEHLAITEASQRRLFFERQLEQAKDNLANAEEAMKVTEQKRGLIQLDSQARALIETAASLRAEIAAKEVQIESMGTYATGENAQLIQAQQELESLRAQLAKLGGSGNLDAGLMVLKGQVPEAGLEYLRKLRDVKYYETIFDILARQFELAKLDEAREGALVQVVDPGVPPDKHSFPKRALIVIGATVVGFLFAIFTLLFRAVLGRMQNDPDVHEKLLDLRRSFTSRKASAS